MTIPTTQNVVSDTKKTPLQADSVVVTVTDDSIPTKPGTAKPAARSRRNGGCAKVILVCLLLVGLACASLGSYYIYKSFRPSHHKNRYRGRCSLPVKSPSTSKNVTFTEDVDIDDNLETIKVPKFDDNDEATFIHNFELEISVIKDDTDKVCYVLPLDTERIPRPQTFVDLIYALRTGQYVLDADQIRTDYEVVHPAVDSMDVPELYGDYVAGQCADYATYELRKVDAVQTTTTTMSTYRFQRRYIMFPGGTILFQYTIYD